jgi:hypothetical protein
VQAEMPSKQLFRSDRASPGADLQVEPPSASPAALAIRSAIGGAGQTPKQQVGLHV